MTIQHNQNEGYIEVVCLNQHGNHTRKDTLKEYDVMDVTNFWTVLQVTLILD